MTSRRSRSTAFRPVRLRERKRSAHCCETCGRSRHCPITQTIPHVVARLWAHVCRTGLFAPGVLDPVNERLAAIRKAYVWDRANSVSCHNDPSPGEHPVRRAAPLADRTEESWLSQRPGGRRFDRDGPLGPQPGTRGSAAAGLARPARRMRRCVRGSAWYAPSPVSIIRRLLQCVRDDPAGRP